MFDIGFLELLIIGVVGLLVLGPERLPKAARTVGLWIGKIKRTVSGMQREINAQLEAEELRQKLNEQQKKLDAGLGKARRDVESYVESSASQDDARATPPGTVSSSGEDKTRDARAAEPADTPTGAEQAEHEPVAPPSSPTDVPAADDKDSASR